MWFVVFAVVLTLWVLVLCCGVVFFAGFRCWFCVYVCFLFTVCPRVAVFVDVGGFYVCVVLCVVFFVLCARCVHMFLCGVFVSAGMLCFCVLLVFPVLLCFACVISPCQLVCIVLVDAIHVVCLFVLWFVYCLLLCVCCFLCYVWLYVSVCVAVSCAVFVLVLCFFLPCVMQLLVPPPPCC